ncbi:hypothetical protein [Algoriphagus halophilus]|uniref:Lipoprotein n=1 Tax=Algoriphagus halophilus TaxID=226505 RepID=A0A1N6FQ81_9BACT|nr:hypothetical protein [Algoriphagus halophilus]SIN97400.1 hypothetical protein SAMN05444394_2629 [Algoriphagus halophilus]
MKKILYVYAILMISSCSYCDFINEQNSKEFSGKVVNLKVYEWDRGKKVLEVNSEKGNGKYYFPTDYKYDPFWEKIIIGDSVFKAKNSTIFFIYREERLLDKMNLDFNCLD